MAGKVRGSVVLLCAIPVISKLTRSPFVALPVLYDAYLVQ